MNSADPPPHPAPRPGLVPGPLGRLAASVYGAEITRRNRRFDAGKGVARLPIPVISVGNLSVGGTGKTPMVMHILTLLASRGLSPCIAMRGYGAERGESDEAAEYARAFPTVPVVAQPDRIAGLRELLRGRPGRLDVTVLDDGFQHRRLARNLDIVLIDATRSPFSDHLLPRGWLREPVESLRRAHAVVATHAESAAPGATDELLRRALLIHPHLLTAVASHAWADLRTSPASGAENNGATLPVSALHGQRILVACAIGNPAPFVAMAERQIGRPAVGAILRRDHDPFSPAAIDALTHAARSARADFILTTEKDWSKLRGISTSRWPCPVLRPRLVLDFNTGEGALADAVLQAAKGSAPDTPPRAV